MGKILDAEFRKELYKNLIDAGYDKNDAQKIVGKKYYAELRDDVIHEVDLFLNSLVKETFDISLNYDEVSKKIEELKKMKELLTTIVKPLKEEQ